MNKHITGGGEEKKQTETIRNKEPTTYFILKTNRNHTQKTVFHSFSIKNKSFYYAVHSTSRFNSKMQFSFTTNILYSLLNNGQLTNNTHCLL